MDKRIQFSCRTCGREYEDYSKAKRCELNGIVEIVIPPGTIFEFGYKKDDKTTYTGIAIVLRRIERRIGHYNLFEVLKTGDDINFGKIVKEAHLINERFAKPLILHKVIMNPSFFYEISTENYDNVVFPAIKKAIKNGRYRRLDLSRGLIDYLDSPLSHLERELGKSETSERFEDAKRIMDRILEIYPEYELSMRFLKLEREDLTYKR